ncbi:PH domain-containing protein [Lacunisphaera limnophila]|nr:PH domain-containing protein [Lacunisphaera limnophila]
MKTVYPTRVDTWLACLLIGAPLFAVTLGLFTLTYSIGAGVVVIATGLLVGGMIAALTLPCRYTLSNESLKIQSGLIEEEVPLRAIRGVEKTISLFGAPGLSLRRVKVTLQEGSRVISPENRDAFIADLEARLHPKNHRDPSV